MWGRGESARANCRKCLPRVAVRALLHDGQPATVMSRRAASGVRNAEREPEAELPTARRHGAFSWSDDARSGRRREISPTMRAKNLQNWMNARPREATRDLA